VVASKATIVAIDPATRWTASRLALEWTCGGDRQGIASHGHAPKSDTMTTLFVSATGGHLAELHQLVHRLDGVSPDRHWVTFDSEQSREILRGERVTFAPAVAPRDILAIAANLPLAHRLLRRGDIDCVVSNGSGIALSYLPMARALRIPAHYIECAARMDGPSLTGRLLQRVPDVRLYSQHPRWADGRWRYAGSVLDNFVARTREGPAPVARVLVTIGTLLPFRRLVERLVEILPPEVEVIWQTGATDVSELPIDAHASVPLSRLEHLASDVDVVVAHAGIGSALMAIRAGKQPILVPRDAGEHVDDHQHQIARELASRGLAIASSAQALTFEDFRRAAASTVDLAAAPPRFKLAGNGREGRSGGRTAKRPRRQARSDGLGTPGRG
jgi:UDP-N-acetylglucosamine transferase subunit ALG13